MSQTFAQLFNQEIPLLNDVLVLFLQLGQSSPQRLHLYLMKTDGRTVILNIDFPFIKGHPLGLHLVLFFECVHENLQVLHLVLQNADVLAFMGGGLILLGALVPVQAIERTVLPEHGEP